MRYVFSPFNGVNSIVFGMSREQCRHRLNSPFTTFKRNQFSKNTTDYFSNLHMFIEFDSNDNCAGIEFHSYTVFIYEGKNLFDFKYSDLIEHYIQKSPDKDIEENASATFYDLGFGTSRSSDGDKIETIVVFPINYWRP